MADLKFEVRSLRQNQNGLSVSNWKVAYMSFKEIARLPDYEVLLSGSSIRVAVESEPGFSDLMVIANASNQNRMLINWNK